MQLFKVREIEKIEQRKQEKEMVKVRKLSKHHSMILFSSQLSHNFCGERTLDQIFEAASFHKVLSCLQAVLQGREKKHLDTQKLNKRKSEGQLFF